MCLQEGERDGLIGTRKESVSENSQIWDLSHTLKEKSAKKRGVPLRIVIIYDDLEHGWN